MIATYNINHTHVYQLCTYSLARKKYHNVKEKSKRKENENDEITIIYQLVDMCAYFVVFHHQEIGC